jgi:hypothetical protein
LSLNLVKRPFKSNGEFFAPGTIIEEPEKINLYRNKVREGKIVVVDEHNVDDVAEYLDYRQGIEIKSVLYEALGIKNEHEKEYLAKVERLATKYDIAFEGRAIEDVVADIKAKQEANKTAAGK